MNVRPRRNPNSLIGAAPPIDLHLDGTDGGRDLVLNWLEIHTTINPIQ